MQREREVCGAGDERDTVRKVRVRGDVGGMLGR